MSMCGYNYDNDAHWQTYVIKFELSNLHYDNVRYVSCAAF